MAIEEKMKKSTKERVLEAATNLLVKRGAQATTTRQIAEDAEVNEVTLFRNFQSKDNLLSQVICNVERNALEFLDSLLDVEQNLDVKTFLRLIGQRLNKFSREKTDLWMLQFTEGLRDPSVAKTLSSIPQKVLTYLTSYFESQMKKGTLRALNPKGTALIFLSYISYRHLAEQIINDSFLAGRDSSFETFLEVMTRGILAPGGSKY
jgi:AcrR family transcriptional regulator